MGRRYESEEWIEWLLHGVEDSDELRDTYPNGPVMDAGEKFSVEANRVVGKWITMMEGIFAERGEERDLAEEFSSLATEDDAALNTYYLLGGYGTGFDDERPSGLTFGGLEAAIEADKKLGKAYDKFTDEMQDQAFSVVGPEENPGKRLTKADVKKQVKAVGLAARWNHEWGEWRVAFPGKGNEASAYYTDDNEDAVGAAKLMAKSLSENPSEAASAGLGGLAGGVLLGPLGAAAGAYGALKLKDKKRGRKAAKTRAKRKKNPSTKRSSSATISRYLKGL